MTTSIGLRSTHHFPISSHIKSGTYKKRLLNGWLVFDRAIRSALTASLQTSYSKDFKCDSSNYHNLPFPSII